MAYQDVEKLAIDDYRIDLSQYVKKSDFINTAHPVGDVVIRLDNVNPGTLPGFEGTTWQKVSEGRMLIGANSSYEVGSTGGTATHKHRTQDTTYTGKTGGTTLTAAQSGLRSHNHTQNQHRHKPEAVKFMVASEDVRFSERKHQYSAASSSGVYFVVSDGNTNGIGEREYTGYATATNIPAAASNATASHDHTNNHTHPAQDTTDASSLPPYLAVNIWRRTA